MAPDGCYVDATGLPSAIYKAMHRQEFPKREVVEAIIIGCCGQADLPAFVSGWHHINSA